MGMSTYLIGYKEPDEKWRQMKAVWDACEAAGIDAPDNVREFFNYDDPEPYGLPIKLGSAFEVAEDMGVTQLDGDVGGFEVDLSKLPPDIKILRFENSW